MIDSHETDQDGGFENTDRPSFARVESFLGLIEERQRQARRTRWLAFAVATAIAAVATLTAVGKRPAEAQNAVLSPTAVVAVFASSN